MASLDYRASCGDYAAIAGYFVYYCDCVILHGHYKDVENPKKMIDRIFKNWKTTLLGIGLIIAGLLFVWFEKATLTELTAFIGSGLVLMLVKDPGNEKNNNS